MENFESRSKDNKGEKKIEKDGIETSILLLKKDGLPDSHIIQGLENPPSGKQGFSKQEIDQAYQRLRDYGFIDKDGLITEEGIDALENM